MPKAEESLYVASQKGLVASLLHNPESLTYAIENVSPDDFSEPTLAVVYSAMREAARRGLNSTVPIIAQILDDGGNFENVGGARALFDLERHGVKASLEAPVRFYADRVKEGSVRNSIQNTIESKKEELQPDSGQTVLEVVDSLANSLNQELFRLGSSEDIVNFPDALARYKEVLAKRLEKTKESRYDNIQGIPTPIKSLNKYTSGWGDDQLITVGARTGIGKSLFATACATAAACAGKSVLFFSLEMSGEELFDRIISNLSQINQTRLKSGDIGGLESDLDDVVKQFNDLKIQIDPTPETTIDTIRAKALQKKQSADGLDLLIIDYIQLVKATPGRRFNSRQEEVADLSRNAKLLAKQLHIPVIILSQLNREKNGEEDSTPGLDNIRESGAIGQDSDIVIFLHRDNKESVDDTEPPKTKIILAKNRGGVSNRTIVCRSFLSTSTFFEETYSRTDDDDTPIEASVHTEDSDDSDEFFEE